MIESIPTFQNSPVNNKLDEGIWDLMITYCQYAEQETEHWCFMPLSADSHQWHGYSILAQMKWLFKARVVFHVSWDGLPSRQMKGGRHSAFCALVTKCNPGYKICMEMVTIWKQMKLLQRMFTFCFWLLYRLFVTLVQRICMTDFSVYFWNVLYLFLLPSWSLYRNVSPFWKPTLSPSDIQAPSPPFTISDYMFWITRDSGQL